MSISASPLPSSSSTWTLNPISPSIPHRALIIICSSKHTNYPRTNFTIANQLRLGCNCNFINNERWKKKREEVKREAVRREKDAVEREIGAVAERLKVVALVAVAMCLCSVDRVAMSVAVVPLADKWGWSTSFIGIVQSSFLWGYVVSSVIGGALADKYGGKTVMAWGLALWSLFTLLTPWAAHQSATCLLLVRALFGLAEGVAFPAMNLILSRWFPIHERARAVGISMAGFQLGNVIGLCLTPILMLQIDVSSPFLLFSSLGLLWLTIWVYGVTNDPSHSLQISQSELQLIQAGKEDSRASNGEIQSIGLLLSKRPSWAIIVANVTNNWGYFVLLSWMPLYFKTVFPLHEPGVSWKQPLYLKEVLDVDLKQAAWFSAVPWGVMAVSSCIVGAISDRLIKAGYRLIFVRKVMQSIGFIGPGVSLLCLNYTTTPSIASVVLTVALSLSSFCQAGYFLNMQDIAPQSAGLLHGISNAVGTLVAIFGTIGAGYFLEWLGSFKAFLTLTATVYFAATVFYNLFAIGERVV